MLYKAWHMVYGARRNSKPNAMQAGQPLRIHVLRGEKLSGRLKQGLRMLYLILQCRRRSGGRCVAGGQNFVIGPCLSSTTLSMVGLFLCHNVQVPVCHMCPSLFGALYWLDLRLYDFVFGGPSAANLQPLLTTILPAGDGPSLWTCASLQHAMSPARVERTHAASMFAAFCLDT